MNRILIVGHPASGYRDVEGVLRQCGMNEAQPSRRDALRPQDITATLCKVHRVPQADSVVAEDDIEQIQAAPVWHGMALDLMLGNLDQELWGWADPDAIHTLDYWKQLDDKLTFVLVYDSPQRALMESSHSAQDLSESTLERQLDNWAAYNGALLRFYLRNTDRCLLVHAQQVRRNADACLQQLQPLLDAPLAALPVEHQAETTQQDLLALPQLPAQRLADIVSLAGLEPSPVQQALQAEAVEHHLLDEVLRDYPASQQLYAELQSAASLPLHEPAREASRALKAWAALHQQRTQAMELAGGLYAAYQQQAASLQQAAADQGKENELLLSQLHQVQEELERHYLGRQEQEQRSAQQEADFKRQAEQLRSKVAELQAALEEGQAAAAKVEAQLRQQQEAKAKQLAEVQSKLEAEKVAHAKAASQPAPEQSQSFKALAEENELLLTQLHQVQEELERYYLDNQRLKKQQVPAKPALYGAAQRVKQQLSYRLGAVMIERSRSLGGWLAMPWALSAEVRAFRQEHATKPAENLPPIHQYRDAHEAERVKQHLSYRLGNTLIRHGGSPLGWVKLPYALGREVRQFRQQRLES